VIEYEGMSGPELVELAARTSDAKKYEEAIEIHGHILDMGWGQAHYTYGCYFECRVVLH
jgi:hypothetical protein